MQTIAAVLALAVLLSWCLPAQAYRDLTYEQLKAMDSTYTDKGKFDKDYWAKGTFRPVPRLEMFNRFLKKYDLIGMSKDQLLEILSDNCDKEYIGDDNLDCVIYRMMTVGCDLSAMPQVKIHFDKGTVDWWCFMQYDKQWPPIFKNVVIMPFLPEGRCKVSNFPPLVELKVTDQKKKRK